MNTTVEISIPSLMTACLLLGIFVFSALNVTESMKRDKSIMGYTSIKTINIGDANVIVDYESEAGVYEK